VGESSLVDEFSPRVCSCGYDAPMTRLSRASVAAMAVAASLLLGACQSAPPALTDPREILAAAVAATSAANTVRIDGSADGTIGLELAGFETPSAVELTGTTFSADLDLESGDARATFSAPGLLGLTGEVIVVEGTTYLKTTLTGALYRTMPGGVDVPEPSGAARATVLDALTGLLARPELDPVKAEDVACGNTTCYRVEIMLSPADLATLGARDLEAPTGLPIPIPLPDLTAATVDLTVLVAQDTTRLAGITANTDLGADGAAAVDLTFSKWDEAVSIGPPPPDQVAP
jgi:hypothetical protein